MGQRRQLIWVLAGVAGFLFLGYPGPARAQECVITMTGPLTLTSRQVVTVCATNLGAPRTVRLGVAFYDAFNAREPLRLDYLDLAAKAGACASFRAPGRTSHIVAQVGYVSAAGDPKRPLAASAEVFRRDLNGDGDVDGRDFLVWQRGDDGPLV